MVFNILVHWASSVLGQTQSPRICGTICVARKAKKDVNNETPTLWIVLLDNKDWAAGVMDQVLRDTAEDSAGGEAGTYRLITPRPREPTTIIAQCSALLSVS